MTGAMDRVFLFALSSRHLATSESFTAAPYIDLLLNE
uniref:Uncharacterized protein n=1 Tax=Utricularia reniformis TaxID=192314 RepID=A0A1Y0B0U7_9LAMI|nr:hypothetical protein AEK19_MT0855 [Utricularia reniformis]YP_009382282.1 hypothetical protein AEK19_MT1854 [Utricularia reniformis]ART31086.1 hypothetical protein AEK19_MT0855 [Utricularia reniformis]ART32025.1 hypothetical protein AEK19_MT1854 [Utricularia reniformis]